MAEKVYRSIKEFYPYYLTEHQKTGTQVLHFIGTGLVIALFIEAILTQSWWRLLLIPVAGYGFAWIGHFFVEKNKPATFQYPLYSLGSDFIMFWHILTFQLPKKMKEAKEQMQIDNKEN